MRDLFARLLVVLALTGAGTAGGVAAGVGGPASAAGSEPCVGVVVDARPLGGSVSVRCSQGAAGRDSMQVLQDAGFRVRLSATGTYAGFLCQLNGLPASSSDDDGCGADADNYRYWGFFVRAPGEKGWTYSNKGVRGYKPADGAQIGFRFETSQTNEPPPVYAQDEICAPKASAAPSRAAAASKAPAAPAPRRSTAAPSSGGTGTTQGSGSAATRSTAPVAGSGTPGATGSGGGDAGAGPSVASSGVVSPGAAGLASASPVASPSVGAILPENGEPVPAGNDLGAGQQEAANSSGVPLTGVFGVLLLLGLGVVAFLRQRSRQPR